MSYLRGHLLMLIPDSLALGTYFGFETLSKISTAVSSSVQEIIINETEFYIFILLFLPVGHILLALYTHSPISTKLYKEKFLSISLIVSFFIFLFSGYFVSTYVETKLINANYNFCENLSYSGNYRSTHYVWRLKNLSCDINTL